jgi:nucleoside-diphosphate-sugar epimerase
MKILVTGGSGFLGAEIIKKLISRGFKVSNLDLITNNNNDIQNFQIDILEKNNLELVFKNNNFDIVIHSCAKVPISNSKKNFNEVNVQGTKNVLELTKKYKVRRFVYISSSAVYGLPKKVPIKEDDIREPVEPYGLSKKQGEDLCLSEMNNTNIGIIRPRTVIGGDRLGIFSILFEWIKSDLPVPVLNNGNNLYQFIDVDDLAEAICLIGLSKYVGSLNIGSNSYTSIRDILSQLIKYNSSNSKIKNLDSSLVFNFLKFCVKYNIVPLKEYHYLAYGKDIYFDTSLSKKILNWEPSISNFESLKNSYNNFINHKNINLENQAVHKKPLKSLILKYASIFL